MVMSIYMPCELLIWGSFVIAVLCLDSKFVFWPNQKFELKVHQEGKTFNSKS